MDIFQKLFENADNSKDTDSLLNQLDSQGATFNKLQHKRVEEGANYLDMHKLNDLGGEIREPFEAVQKTEADMQEYQRQISKMAGAQKMLMTETNQLIDFVNNPKYRGKTLTI